MVLAKSILILYKLSRLYDSHEVDLILNKVDYGLTKSILIPHMIMVLKRSIMVLTKSILILQNVDCGPHKVDFDRPRSQL